MRRALALTLGAIAATLLAGCGSSQDTAQRIALAALDTRSPSQAAPAPSGPAPLCGHLTSSLRPPAAMPAPGAMPPGSFMARIEKRGHLVAGVDQNTLLLAYFNPVHRRLEGFEIDLLRQVSKAIFGNPNRLLFRAVTPAERIPDVQDGSVNIVADATTITCERRRQVDFSTVYLQAGQQVLVPLNAPVRSIGDLGHKRVCAAAGSTSIAKLATLRPRPIPVSLPQRIDCLVALQQGRVAAISTDSAILDGFRAQDPYTKIVGPLFTKEPYGMAISKEHPDFVRFVNGVLAHMRADGAWRALYARWLGRPVPAPPAAQYDG